MVAFLHYKDGSKLSHSCAGMMGRERERERERASEQRFGRRTEAVLSLQVLAALAFWIAMSVRISGVFLQRERERERVNKHFMHPTSSQNLISWKTQPYKMHRFASVIYCVCIVWMLHLNTEASMIIFNAALLTLGKNLDLTSLCIACGSADLWSMFCEQLLSQSPCSGRRCWKFEAKKHHQTELLCHFKCVEDTAEKLMWS